MMPKRVAETDPNKQITDSTGSGPFIFKKEEWKPGEKAVYVKNPKYKPRAEPPSGFAGGKVAKVDRVEWVCDRRPADRRSTPCINGEIDLIEAPPHDLLPLVAKDANIELLVIEPAGPPVCVPLQRPAQALRQRQGAPGRRSTPSTRRTSSTPPSAIPSTTVTCKSLFILRLAAGDRPRAGTTRSAATSPRPRRC